MNIISFIGSSHEKVSEYSVDKLIRAIKSHKPVRVIATIDPDSKGRKESYRKAINAILSDPEISSLVVRANVDESKFQNMRDDFFEKNTGNADALVKKNIMEMIETTINSYLEGYWKDFESVNSEVTDSLYRAMHKLISTMFWEVERETWNAMLDEITANVKKLEPGPDDVILVDVEKKYWLEDNLEQSDE